MAWAAGLFEGEGCLRRKQDDHWALQLKMTDVDVVMHFASMYGLKVNHWDNNVPEHYLPVFECQTGKRDLIFRIVCDFYPYLGERRREKCDEFLAWYQEKKRETTD